MRLNVYKQYHSQLEKLLTILAAGAVRENEYVARISMCNEGLPILVLEKRLWSTAGAGKFEDIPSWSLQPCPWGYRRKPKLCERLCHIAAVGVGTACVQTGFHEGHRSIPIPAEQ